MSRFAQQIHRHYLLSALLLGCLVLRAFVPAGYMVDTDAAGTLSLKMCSGITLTAPADSTSDHDTPPESSDNTGSHGLCPASVPLLALAHALLLSADEPTGDYPVPAAALPARSSLPPSPSRLPRGPPATHA